MYTRKCAAVILLFLLLSLSCGCAKSSSLVALVPDPDGHVGSIVVSNQAGSVAVGSPYQAVTVTGPREAPSNPVTLGRERVAAEFAEALSIEPRRPLHFFLYFREGFLLLPQSQKLVPEILAAVRERQPVDISIVGHADTLGTSGYNRDISRRRVATVEELLVRNGVDPGSISRAWYGETHLLVHTPDEVADHRNRAVEVVVR